MGHCLQEMYHFLLSHSFDDKTYTGPSSLSPTCSLNEGLQASVRESSYEMFIPVGGIKDINLTAHLVKVYGEAVLDNGNNRPFSVVQNFLPRARILSN